MPKEPIHLPDVPMGTTIPRILHQHFLMGEAAIPCEIRKIRHALLEANPGWADSFWDAARAEAFIGEVYGDGVLERYRRIRPEYVAARSDLLRYLVLYVQGGVYLDVKSSCRLPLDEAIRPQDRFLLMSWGVTGHHELKGIAYGELVQWAIVTVQGHPFLREVIARVLRNIDEYAEWRTGVGRKGTLRLTGPVAYTLAIDPVRTMYPHTYLHDPGERGFVYTMLPDMASHRALFGPASHYTGLNVPLVEESPFSSLVSHGVRVVRRIPLLAGAARWLRPRVYGRPR
jgi:hypothetical protein